jgi:hypothetical protein
MHDAARDGRDVARDERKQKRDDVLEQILATLREIQRERVL